MTSLVIELTDHYALGSPLFVPACFVCLDGCAHRERNDQQHGVRLLIRA